MLDPDLGILEIKRLLSVSSQPITDLRLHLKRNIESRFMAYFIVGIFIVSAGICSHFAKSKQLNVPFWIVLGSLLGPLAIPFVVFAKSKNPSGNSS